MQSIARKNVYNAGKCLSRFREQLNGVKSVGHYGEKRTGKNGRGLIMPRKHKNARHREGPRESRIQVIKPKVIIYSCPKRKRGDIYPGRVVAIAEPGQLRIKC